MDVEMGNGFSALFAVVDDEAETVADSELAGRLTSHEQKVPEEGLEIGGGFADAREGMLGDDEQMNGSLRIYIVKNDALIVLMFDIGGNLSVDDSRK